MRHVVFMGMLLACSGCQLGAKTAADAVKTEQCVTSHWGEPAVQVAAECFDGELQLAIDSIADIEYLLQKRGAKPTPAYQQDARVSQIVITRMASNP